MTWPGSLAGQQCAAAHSVVAPPALSPRPRPRMAPQAGARRVHPGTQARPGPEGAWPPRGRETCDKASPRVAVQQNHRFVQTAHHPRSQQQRVPSPGLRRGDSMCSYGHGHGSWQGTSDGPTEPCTWCVAQPARWVAPHLPGRRGLRRGPSQDAPGGPWLLLLGSATPVDAQPLTKERCSEQEAAASLSPGHFVLKCSPPWMHRYRARRAGRLHAIVTCPRSPEVPGENSRTSGQAPAGVWCTPCACSPTAYLAAVQPANTDGGSARLSAAVLRKQAGDAERYEFGVWGMGIG